MMKIPPDKPNQPIRRAVIEIGENFSRYFTPSNVETAGDYIRSGTPNKVVSVGPGIGLIGGALGSWTEKWLSWTATPEK